MNMSIDDLAASEAFGGGKGRREQISWLPEPAPRERVYTVISVDDHVVEPPDAFTGRFPQKFSEEEPRIVPTEIPSDRRSELKAALRQNAPGAYWDGAARLLIAREPEVLT